MRMGRERRQRSGIGLRQRQQTVPKHERDIAVGSVFAVGQQRTRKLEAARSHRQAAESPERAALTPERSRFGSAVSRQAGQAARLRHGKIPPRALS